MTVACLTVPRPRDGARAGAASGRLGRLTQMVIGPVVVKQRKGAGATVFQIVRVAILHRELDATGIGARFTDVRGTARVVTFNPSNVVAILSAVANSGQGGGSEGSHEEDGSG